MNLNQEQMDNLVFVDDDPLHLLSNILGDVLDDLEFESDLVDEAKKLFILADTQKASGEITMKVSRMVTRTLVSYAEAQDNGIFSKEQFEKDKENYKNKKNNI